MVPMGVKPVVTTKPKPAGTAATSATPKWGGGPGLKVAGADDTSSKSLGNIKGTPAVNGTVGGAAVMRDGKPGAGEVGERRLSKVEERIAALQGGKPAMDKPKPGAKPPVAAKFKTSDQNNNPDSNAVGKFGVKLNQTKPNPPTRTTSESAKPAQEGIAEIARKASKTPSAGTGSPSEKTASKPVGGGLAQKVNLFQAANGTAQSPLDLRAALKPVNKKRSDLNSESSDNKHKDESEEVALRNRANKDKRSRLTIHKSVIRNSDGRKFHRVDVSSIENVGPPPEKPPKLDVDIDLADMIAGFEYAVHKIGMLTMFFGGILQKMFCCVRKYIKI